MLIEQEGNLEEEEEANEGVEMNEIEEAVVSMFASSNNPHLSTLRFKGKISDREIYALLDSVSTNNFVHPSTLQGIKYKIIDTNSMVVMLATGVKVVTDSKCLQLIFSLQGHEFSLQGV
jgi:polyribonucleotide nucleotidyltransferase